MKIKNTRYFINNSITNTEIVLISDLHYYSKKNIKLLNKVLKKIKIISPEFICIPGDLIDESNILNSEEFISWLTKLSNISKVILSLGNHEFYIDKSSNKYGLNKELYKKIKNIDNLYFLNNENVQIDNINFIGLTLPIEHFMQQSEQNFSISTYSKFIDSKKECYNVLLCHSPINIVNYADKLNIDLALCGHMHGGLMPFCLRKIFKGKGLISPHKKIFPNNCYGLVKKDKAKIIITSGITVISHLNSFKIFNKLFSPEIVTIKITN